MTIRGRRFDWGVRTYIMGIVNVSPESFSGDGLSSVAEAVAQARGFADEGADSIDVGGQSTRPGFEELSVEEELARVVPVVRALGLPLLTGTSRKSTIGAVLVLPEDRRLLGTAATVSISIGNRADIVRVHDVAAMAQVCRMTDAIVRAGA